MNDTNAPLAVVTGAPGWLGTRLVETLLRGMAEVPGLEEPLGDRGVRCLVLPGANSAPLRGSGARVEPVEGDLRDAESLRRLCRDAHGATLFHVAGVIHPARGTKEFWEVNADGTRNLVDAAETAGVRRLVHVSSNSPIGTNPTKDHEFDETAPYNPYMGYGKSKRVAEEIVKAASARGAMETVIIRPPWFYGPGQPPRQDLFFRMISEGKAPIVGGGKNRRSMAYIDNICQGLLLCERVEQAKGGVYWIADRRSYSMNEIVDTIERVMERDFAVKVRHKRARVPGVVSRIAWVVDLQLQWMGLYHQRIHVLSEMNKTIACSVARAEKELGYAPKVELEEGMRRSIRWMLDNSGSL